MDFTLFLCFAVIAIIFIFCLLIAAEGENTFGIIISLVGLGMISTIAGLYLNNPGVSFRDPAITAALIVLGAITLRFLYAGTPIGAADWNSGPIARGTVLAIAIVVVALQMNKPVEAKTQNACSPLQSAKSAEFQRLHIQNTEAANLAYDSMQDCLNPQNGAEPRNAVECGADSAQIVGLNSFSAQDQEDAKKVILDLVKQQLRGSPASGSN